MHQQFQNTFRMKTLFYNPSTLEVEFTNVIANLKEEIQQQLSGYTITKVDNNVQLDNPRVVFTLQDSDGDRHELMIQFIQRIDD